MLPDRSWMFHRLDAEGRISREFRDGVDGFIKFVCEHPTAFDTVGHMLCPCSWCKNGCREVPSLVLEHLQSYGFMDNYDVWDAHGEEIRGTSNSRNVVDEDVRDERSPARKFDLFGDSDAVDTSFTGSRTSSPFLANVPSEVRNTHTSPDRRKVIRVAEPMMDGINMLERALLDSFELEDEEAALPDDVEVAPVNHPAQNLCDLFGDTDDVDTSSPSLADASSEEDGNTLASPDRREVIWVERPMMRRFRPTSITNKIMKEVMKRLPGFAPTWKDYPRDMKDTLYTMFMATYKFFLPEDELLGRKVWDQTCQDRYPESLRNLRLAGLEKNNTSDVAQTRDNPPKGIKLEVWNQFVDYWLSEKFQRRSEIAKVNRCALPNAAVHSGGSISFAVTQEKMEKEKGGPVSLRDLYKRTHKKKGTEELISEHAREFLEKLDAGLARKYGDDPSQYPKFDQAIWLEATRPNKKRRVEGLGRSIALSIDSCNNIMASSCSQPRQARKSEIHEMNEKMNTLQKNMENIQQTQEGMQQLLASMKVFLSSMATSPRDAGASSHQQDPTRDRNNGASGSI